MGDESKALFAAIRCIECKRVYDQDGRQFPENVDG